ncbi:MAG TPA: TonB-dependent receptor plug domain-containing protein [Vicinamibacteria bacterium]|nr:TonB-dependent receptor plug domain-containing protein [Vicinamibacteria bacterium]
MNPTHRDRSARACILAALILVWAGVGAPLRADSSIDPAAPPRRDLTELSLDELAALEITTVSRTAEMRSRSAAAVFVITQQDIRRSGATNLAEALRLAPGVQISRINSNQWAVGMRGFASRLSRSVLVLIDGRSVYTPLFAGTYWEVQDVLLEDIDRIEVIRGPGGTLWGANAVNGVINIITRSAKDTHGTFLEAGAGNEETGFGGARWGGALGAHTDVRVYAKYFDRDGSFRSDGPPFDDWRMGQGGFRLDAERGPSAFTVQGDAYDGHAGERTNLSAYTAPFLRTVDEDADLSGGNLRAQWRRQLGPGSDLAAQAYYDRTRRVEPGFEETRNTVDLDLQYSRQAGRHALLAGGGYRFSRGVAVGVPTIVFTPAARTDDIFSAFVQDRFEASPDRLLVTLGVKVERNDYSGLEVQPSARVWFGLRPHQSVWAAVSRAVRTPSRVERDLDLTIATDPARPLFTRLVRSDAFTSENAIVYEAGYRAQRGQRFLVDASLFQNEYANLLSVEPGGAPFAETDGSGTRTIVPFLFGNGIRGRVRGVELAADVRITDAWRVHASYSFLDMDLEAQPDSLDTTTAASTEGSSPRHRGLVRSSLTLGDVQLDAIWRRVSSLPAQGVPTYSSLNARAAWRPWAPLEIAIVGRDLLQSHHVEFGGGTEVERSIYGEVAWRF